MWPLLPYWPWLCPIYCHRTPIADSLSFKALRRWVRHQDLAQLDAGPGPSGRSHFAAPEAMPALKGTPCSQC